MSEPGYRSSIPSPRSLRALFKDKLEGEFDFSRFGRALYATDASVYRIHPAGVVFPASSEDVRATIEIANQHGVPVTPRGGGTSLAGQAVNYGIIMDFSKFMHRILAFDPERKRATVQTGITLGTLNHYLAAKGLHFAPNPSSARYATVGGAIGNNSCGAYSIRYGKTVDHVLGTTQVLGDGTLVRFSTKEKQSTPLHASIANIARNARPEVTARFPKIDRRISGYNLDLVDTDNANLAHLIVGSEGTLAAVTEADLKLEALPKYRGIVVLQHTRLREAMEAAVALVELKPLAVEHIGQLILNRARTAPGFNTPWRFLEDQTTDILAVETSADSMPELRRRLKQIEDKCATDKLAAKTLQLTGSKEISELWRMREAGLGLMMKGTGDAKPVPFVEDTAVAVKDLPQFVESFGDVLANHGVEGGYYGHASVGCMHVRPILNLKRRADVDKMMQIGSDVAELVMKFGGALSGEHGDGIARGYWAEKMFGHELVSSFRDIKKAFDPKGIMNPGKVFDTPAMNANLRYGTEYKTGTLNTDAGPRSPSARWFAREVERCHGMGACRNLQGGVMCPSYVATRDEEHSTRGRANLLREALSNPQMRPYLFSKRMHSALDLCLSCKACKTECPSSVDMAKIKSAFLNNYHATHRYSLLARGTANIHRVNSLISGPLAPAVSRIIASPPARYLAEKMFGVDRRRRFPAVVSETFERKFTKRQAISPRRDAPRGQVALFNDTFTNFNHPEAGVAAVQLLEAAGYQVQLVGRNCCGRPMISHGMLTQARAQARLNVAALHPFVERNVPVTVCEASCLSALKDDYPDLLADDPRAAAIAASVVPISKLLADTREDGGPAISWTERAARVLVHTHCHQKALFGSSSALEALNMPPRYEATLIDAGCCGMAGSFGFERKHYDISLKIGADRLFPAIQSADPGVEIAVTGVSCRQQIADRFADRRPRDLVEVLADALP